MTTTTSYGTWTSRVDPLSLTVEYTVEEAFGPEGANGYDVEAIVRDYRDAINEALPAGVTLAGQTFYGPIYEADHTWGDELDIAGIVAGIDLWAIIERHAVPEDEQFTVQIDAADESGENWQAVHPAENAWGGNADEVARWTLANQTVIDLSDSPPNWRIRVWRGHGADTGVEPAFEFPFQAEEGDLQESAAPAATTTAYVSDHEPAIIVDVLALAPGNEDTDFATAPDGQIMTSRIEFEPRQWDEWEPDVYDAALRAAGWRRLTEWSGAEEAVRVAWVGQPSQS